MKRAGPEIKQIKLKAGTDGVTDRSDSAWQWLYSRIAEGTTTAVKDHRERRRRAQTVEHRECRGGKQYHFLLNRTRLVVLNIS